MDATPRMNMTQMTSAPLPSELPHRTQTNPTDPRLPTQPQYEWPKRLFDRMAGLVLFVVLFPVMAIAWALVRLTSVGPGIYSQTRVGLGGRNYRIYKLRTMTHNCEAKTGGARWSTKGDTRVTPLGKSLRKLHLDELPQLWNVIRGEMSLVGPRPERPEFVGLLSEQIPGYRDRLLVPPGVTGLAQIQLPPDTDLQSVRDKLVLDRSYVLSRGLWLDLRLIAGTGVYLLGFSYRSVRRLFSLPNPLSESRKSPETCPSSVYNQYQANRKPLSTSDSFAVNSV
jgi:lipopolysaccharide/colanic/teichoic acid biosynthesis glycosyltransferase